MTREPNTQHPHSPDDDEGEFAAFIRKVGDLIEAREAANPTPAPPPEPRVDKPGTLIAAEKDLLRWELLERIQPDLCGGPERCKRARCRRARLCAEIESLKPLAEAARVTLAREQAKWQTPKTPPVPERRRRRGALARGGGCPFNGSER